MIGRITSFPIFYFLVLIAVLVNSGCGKKHNDNYIARSDYSILKSKLSNNGQLKAIVIVHAFGPSIGGSTMTQEVRIYPGNTPDNRLVNDDSCVVFSADVFNENMTNIQWSSDQELRILYFEGLKIIQEKDVFRGVKIIKEGIHSKRDGADLKQMANATT